MICTLCDEWLEEDCGRILNAPSHEECALRAIIGGLNHLRGRCSCCGGTEPPDPPELSKREAAIAAVEYWRSPHFEMWTVYDHPLDYPEHFVARKFTIGGGLGTRATDDIRTAPTLEELRAQLPPGLACLHRSPGDDPCIVEAWL